MTVALRVLVTGGSGCIGRALLPRLVAAGHDVHATARQPMALATEGVTWHAADLLREGDTAALIRDTRPDVLVHLAWYVAPGRWALAAENADWLAASIRLVRSFVEAGGRRFVGAGSGLEYDWAHGYCTEDVTPCQPHTLYGTAKLAAWQVLRQVCASAGVEYSWARVFFVYGPHEHPDRLVPVVVRALLQRRQANVSHGRQIRDYLHVDDVAGAFLCLVDTPNASGVYNVCSGVPIALRSIVEEVGRQLEGTELISFGAVPQAATDTPFVVGNPGRLLEIGWQPSIALPAGIKGSIEWWRTAEPGTSA